MSNVTFASVWDAIEGTAAEFNRTRNNGTIAF